MKNRTVHFLQKKQEDKEVAMK